MQNWLEELARAPGAKEQGEALAAALDTDFEVLMLFADGVARKVEQWAGGPLGAALLLNGPSASDVLAAAVDAYLTEYRRLAVKAASTHHGPFCSEVLAILKARGSI